jgi:hypothetical protein
MAVDFSTYNHVESETLVKKIFFKATQEGIQNAMDDFTSRERNYSSDLQLFLPITRPSKFNEHLLPCSSTSLKVISHHDRHLHSSRCEVCHRECSGSGHMSCGKCCSSSEHTGVVARGYCGNAGIGQDGSSESKSSLPVDSYDDFHSVFEHDGKEPLPWLFVAYMFELCLFWIICLGLSLFPFGVFCSNLSVNFVPVLFSCVHAVCMWFSNKYTRWWSQTSTAVRCYSLTSKCLFLIIV